MIYLDDQDPDAWSKKHGFEPIYEQCTGCGQVRRNRRPWISKDYAGMDYFCDNEGKTCNHKSMSMVTISEAKQKEWSAIFEELT